MSRAPVRKDFLKAHKREAADKRGSSNNEPPAEVSEINLLALSWKRRLGKWKAPDTSKPFKLGSDCAGYGSELIALRLLGLQKRCYLAMFCENDADKVALHRETMRLCGFDASDCHHYDDMFARNNRESLRVDLYVAGFPCPAFSRLGLRRGTADRRGVVTLRGLQYIAGQRPRALVLEQVSSILDKDHKILWDYILKTLDHLEYEYTYRILNTRHLGISQSRPRVYLMAVCKESLVHPLVLPPERQFDPDLHNWLQKDLVGNETLSLPTYEAKLGPEMWSHGFVLDVKASPAFQHPLRNCCPCLTKSRCKEHGYYIPKLRRRLTPVEMGKLQGLPTAVIEGLMRTETASARAFEQAVGDGMSINCVQSVIRRALDAAGLTSLGSSKDYWLQCPAPKCHQLADSLWRMCGDNNTPKTARSG